MRLEKAVVEVTAILFFSLMRATSLPKLLVLPPTLILSLKYFSKSWLFMMPSSTGWVQSMVNLRDSLFFLPPPMPFSFCLPGPFLGPEAFLDTGAIWLLRGTCVNRYSALSLKGMGGGKKNKLSLKFTIDCTHPVEDGIMNSQDFEKYLSERIKVGGKTNNFGKEA